MKSVTPASMKPNKTADAVAVRVEPAEVIEYGKASLTVDLPGGKQATIDRAFLAGKGTLKLRHIDVCLKAAGMTVDAKGKGQSKEGREARKWFNKEVRDVWHSALKHQNKVFMTEATPVSIGISDRVSGKKSNRGEVTRTAKFGYELVLKKAEKPAQVIGEPHATGEVKQIEQGKARAKRQSKSKAPKSKAIGTIGQIAEIKQTVEPKPAEATEAPVRETQPQSVEVIA